MVPKVEAKKPETAKAPETEKKDENISEALAAYASTIAEAAEDSEPERPVVYKEY